MNQYEEAAEAIAAMADHQDLAAGDHYAGMPETVGEFVEQTRQTDPTGIVANMLRVLAAEWAEGTNGMGPDGAFVDVAGWYRGEPSFPGYLADMLELHTAKNKQYVGTNPDPLANYVLAGAPLGLPGYKAALMRLNEKVARLNTMVQTGQAIDPTDSALDIAVISLLFLALYKEWR